MNKVCIFAEFPLSAITDGNSGRGGGQAATWLPQIAKAWENCQDLEIHWAVFDRNARQSEKLHAWNQVFHRVPCMGITAGLLMARWPHRAACRRLLCQIQPDLIHCWGTENLNGTALLEFDGPSILSMQGIITTYYRTGDLKNWRWRLFRHWEPVSMRRASVITSESQWGLDRVHEIVPGKPTRKIEYGVAPSYYGVDWSPDPEMPEVLFVGGFNRLKGVDILIKMLERHPRRKWDISFAGGGYLESELRRMANHGVRVLGLLKTSEVQQAMARAWALVLPSRADTSPNVVKEARVIGLPVVVSPHGGHAEYVEHGVDGLLVNSEDPDSWCTALDSLCDNFAKCKAMGEMHHAHFRDHFQPQQTADQFLGLYLDLIRNTA